MKIDIHTHVLPGVDHGAKDWKTALEMLAQSANCGVNSFIATPHYLPWREGVTADVIRQLCQEAEQRLKKEYGISVNVYPGQEIYYSTELVELLRKGEVLTLADSQYVLVEFQQGVPYQTLCKAVRDLHYHRYTPILAHVERYSCLERVDRLIELKQMGAMLQINVNGIQGSLFDEKSRKLKQWLKKGVVDFVASDMHDLEERPPMLNEKLQWLESKLDEQYQRKILCENAEKILASIKTKERK